MKFKTTKNQLIDSLKTVSAAVGKRSANDVIARVEITIDDGSDTCRFRACNKEIAISDSFNCEVGKAGQCYIYHMRLAKVVSELPDGDVVLTTVKDRTLNVTSGANSFNLRLSDADVALPVIDASEVKGTMSIGASFLKTGLMRTWFACDAESTRYALGGIKFDLDGKTLVLVATDSRRLAIFDTLFVVETDVEGPIVPMAVARTLISSIGEDDVTINFRSGVVEFQSGGTNVVSRMVEGRFPRYRDVVPKSSNGDVMLDASVLSSHLRMALAVSEDGALSMSVNDGNLILKSATDEVGESDIKFPVEYSGEPIEMRLNGRFINQMLSAIDPEDPVRWSFIDGESAASFVVSERYNYIVMPLSDI